MSKFQSEIDLESENRAELARMEREAIDAAQRNKIRSKIEKSDEKIQSLAVLMLHYCSGLQNCLDTQEEHRLQAQGQGHPQGQGQLDGQGQIEGQGQIGEVTQIQVQGHMDKGIVQGHLSGINSEHSDANGVEAQRPLGQGQSSEGASNLTSSNEEQGHFTASANKEGFTLGVPVLGKTALFQVGPEVDQVKSEETHFGEKVESNEVLAKGQSTPDECNVTVATPESSAQKS